MKLLLDEHYANEIAIALRAVGHDAVTVSEMGPKGLEDEALLELAASEDRALVTNKARHFRGIVVRWSETGQGHSGVLLTSDRSMPRGTGAIGLQVKALQAFMDANRGSRGLANQTRWLS